MKLINPAVLFLDFYPRERKTYTQMIIAAFSIIEKNPGNHIGVPQ